MAADKRKSKPGQLPILEIRIYILILPARFMTYRV